MFEGTVEDAKKAGMDLIDHAAARVQGLLKNDVPPLIQSVHDVASNLISQAKTDATALIDHVVGQFNGWVVNIPPIRIGKGR